MLQEHDANAHLRDARATPEPIHRGLRVQQSLAHDYKENISHRPLSAHFNYLLLGIPAWTGPCQRTHSCCPPTNLHTLNPAARRAKSPPNMPAGATMREVSLESVERHSSQRKRSAPSLEGVKVGGGGEAGKMRKQNDSF